MIQNTSNVVLEDLAASAEKAPFDLQTLAVFDSLPDALYLFDSEKRLTRINAAATPSQSPESLQGKRCCEMFWRVEGSEECVVDRALKTEARVEVEMLAGADGKQPTLLIVQPIQNCGVTAGAIVIARDISDLRRLEAEALEHKSFLASIADRTPDEIYALDKDGRITWMNERAEADHLLMLSGRFFSEFIAEESRDLIKQNLNHALAGEDKECEVRAIRTDGSACYVEAHTSPLWKEGQVTGVLVFLRDVTERKRAQELMAQSDKLRAVGELAAGVAHNLNNSLTIIQGRAQLLLMRSTDEAAAKNLKIITNAVDDGSKTLRRILDFARREAAREFVPVELAELITSSVEIAKPKWQQKMEGKITVRVENTGPIYVMGEAAELREVVLNLIFNAVDAMVDGGIMELGTRAEIDSGCFWVADTGCGMSAEAVARIFEPFYSTKGKQGTGLGLSASHGIIARHKGEIMVVSEPGEGTRFEVRLALCDDRSRFVKRESSNVEDLKKAGEI
jgi:PAS domain S-box-containing protein